MATYNYPRLRLLWDRKHKCGDGGKGLIDLEISYLRKRKWISTGVTVERRHWRDGKVSGCPDMLRLNMRLTNIVKQYEALLLDLEAVTTKGFGRSIIFCQKSALASHISSSSADSAKSVAILSTCSKAVIVSSSSFEYSSGFPDSMSY